MTTIFRTKIHVGGTKGSIMPEELGGACVCCFTTSADCMHAIENSLAPLRANGLEIREVRDPAYPLEMSEWRRHVEANRPEQADGLVTQEEFERLVGEGGVVFGPFAGYNHPSG